MISRNICLKKRDMFTTRPLVFCCTQNILRKGLYHRNSSYNLSNLKVSSFAVLNSKPRPNVPVQCQLAPTLLNNYNVTSHSQCYLVSTNMASNIANDTISKSNESNKKDDGDIHNISCLIKCVDFAAVKHCNQRRKDKDETPYINHPIGVAKILAIEGGVSDPVVLQAALLHDTVEDTETSFEEIEKEFGKAVRDIVAEVTDDKSLPKMERKRLQIEHASHKSREAKLVKLGDKIYNLRDLEKCTPQGWTETRVQEYFQWASQVVRGLRGTNETLENELDKLFKKRKIVEEK